MPTVGYNAEKVRRWLQVTGGVPTRTGKDPVGHVLFLKNERPEVYEAAYKFLEPMDFLNMRLTGRFTASDDSIVGHWATDNRDLSNVVYDEKLLEWTGVDRDKLPDLLPTGSVVGPLTPAVAADLGLGEHVQVITGTGDTSSAGIGAGTTRDFDAHLYVGTSSWLSCHVPFKKTDLLNNITSLPSGIPQRYWVATEQDVAGGALTWLIDNVLLAEDALNVVDAPDDMLAALNDLAATSPAGSNGVLFFPWLNGERTPVDDHHIRGGWINVGLGTKRADLVRAVFEGVALNTRWMLVYAEKFVEAPVRRRHHVHRWRRASAMWCQIMADVLDRPIRQAASRASRTCGVRRSTRPSRSGTSVGTTSRHWSRSPRPTSRTRRPRTYDRSFAAFTDYYKRTKGLFAKLNR